jgi:hypothetical protein
LEGSESKAKPASSVDRWDKLHWDGSIASSDFPDQNMAQAMRTKKTKAISQTRRLSHKDRLAATDLFTRDALPTEISIRLFTSAQLTDQLTRSRWQTKNSLVYMITDLVSASDGIPRADTKDSLVAQFADPGQALLTARRIQWAVLGFLQNRPQQPAAAAIVVRATENSERSTPSSSSPNSRSKKTFPDSSRPGQILVDEPIYARINNLPDLRFRSAKSAGGFHELVWASPDVYEVFLKVPDAIFEAGEQVSEPLSIDGVAASSTTLEYSRIDQITVPSKTPVDSLDGRPAATHQPNETQIPKSQAGKSALWRSPRRLRMAIIAIALVAVSSGIIAITKHRKQPKAVGIGTTPAVDTAPVPTSSTVRPTTPDQHPPQAGTNPSSEGKGSSTSTSKQPSEPRGGSCDLTYRQVVEFLDMADRNRGQGRYGDAAREYSAVLACDPRNDRARSGLARARSAQAVHTSR